MKEGLRWGHPLKSLDILVNVILQLFSTRLHLDWKDLTAGPVPVHLLQLHPELVEVDDGLDLPVEPGVGLPPGCEGDSLSLQTHGGAVLTLWPVRPAPSDCCCLL